MHLAFASLGALALCLSVCLSVCLSLHLSLSPPPFLSVPFCLSSSRSLSLSPPANIPFRRRAGGGGISNGVEYLRTESSSSQGQHLALTAFFVPSSLDNGPEVMNSTNPSSLARRLLKIMLGTGCYGSCFGGNSSTYHIQSSQDPGLPSILRACTFSTADERIRHTQDSGLDFQVKVLNAFNLKALKTFPNEEGTT